MGLVKSQILLTGLIGFQVGLTGQIFTGSSIKNILVREAKKHAALALVVGYVELVFHHICCGFSLLDVYIYLICFLWLV